MTLPLVTLTGAPYEQGLQHGRILRDRIAANLAIYFERFESEGRLPRADVLARAREYADAIADQNRDYYDTMRGVAEGAGIDLDTIAALNVRYEIIYYQYGVNAMADGCTSFAVEPERSANGHLLLGQNWDWIPGVQGALVQATYADGVQSLAFTEAGIVGGKIGLNSAGLGLTINGLASDEDDWANLGTPFHVRCYEILRSQTIEAGLAALEATPRACAANFLLAQTPDRVVDAESAPSGLHLLGCEGGCLVHANVFIAPSATAVIEPAIENRPSSAQRLDRMRTLLQAQQTVSVPDLQRFLADHDDHPYGICRHVDLDEAPEERYETVSAVVMDLEAGAMWVTDGQPCVASYSKVELGRPSPAALA